MPQQMELRHAHLRVLRLSKLGVDITQYPLLPVSSTVGISKYGRLSVRLHVIS